MSYAEQARPPWEIYGDLVLPVIEARTLVKTYSRGGQLVQALRGVNLAVGKGEFLAVVGPSGSGKSTLLHLLGGLDRADSGDVLIEESPLSSLSDTELSVMRRRRIGLVLQFFNLLPTLSAVENAAFPLMLDGRPDAIARATQMLEAVGLSHRMNHRPATLSGGEQQRVAMARALSINPAVLLADEPTGALDTQSGISILELLRSAADGGQTVVMITHDQKTAAFADRVLHMRDGVLVEVT